VGAYTTTVTGTSPILITNLSSGTTYTCYIQVNLNGGTIGTSSGLSVKTNNTGYTYNNISAIPIQSAVSSYINFTSDNLTVSTGTGSYIYINGTYSGYASSSSTNGGDGGGYIYPCFNNGNSGSFWHTNYSGGTGAYALIGGQYNGSGSYLGTTSTTISAISYIGEWCQIKLPYRLQLTNYYIASRSGQGTTRFPKIFYIAGSNDGTTWYLVDSKSLTTSPDDGTGNLVSFTVNTAGENYYTAYYYFRLVINYTFGGNVVNLIKFYLTGNTNGN